jgi:hypothetical protein
MLQKLSKEIQECYHHADECRQRAERACTEKGRQEFVDMEGRWLSLAHTYEFAEGLANYVEPFRKSNRSLMKSRGRRKREPLPVRSIHAGCPATRPVNLFALGQILRRQTNA